MNILIIDLSKPIAEEPVNTLGLKGSKLRQRLDEKRV